MAAGPATIGTTQLAGARAARRFGSPGRFVKRALIYLILSVGAIGAGFPFFWMLMTSLKTRAEASRTVPTIFPAAPQWHNYVEAWQAAPFGRYFLNTTFICVAVVIGMLFTSTLAAYSFARLNFWGKNVVFALFLATMMIPFEATLIPNYVIVNRLGWYNTYWALIIPWTASVVNIFLLRQFFVSIPGELYDAAALDGCGHLRTLWSIMIPLARAPLAATIIFSFLGSWNSLLWPLLSPARRACAPCNSAFRSSSTPRPTIHIC